MVAMLAHLNAFRLAENVAKMPDCRALAAFQGMRHDCVGTEMKGRHFNRGSSKEVL